jgi:phosphotransferase system HPr (HPr) family protein
MVRESVKIEIKNGLHTRPLMSIVLSLKKLNADVVAVCDNKKANLNSIMEGMLLAAPCGKIIDVEAHGPDEQEAINVIKKILNTQDF